MKKKALRWLRWPLLFGGSAVVGWAITSVVVQRKVAAAWQDVPTRRISLYPAPFGRRAEARVSRLAGGASLRDLTTWLAELAGECSADRLRAALDAARGLPEPWRLTAVETALARLADIDPHAALEYALLRLGDGSAGWNALANLLNSQAASDPEALRRFLPAAAQQLAHGQGGVGMLAALSPDETLALIQRWHLPLDHPGVDEALRGAIDTMAKSDPARALHAIEAIGIKSKALKGYWHSTLWKSTLEWARKSPEAALLWIDQHRDASNYFAADEMESDYLEAIAIGALAPRDPQRVVDWLTARSDDTHPWGATENRVLADLRKVDPDAAWHLLTTQVPPEKQAMAAAAALSGRDTTTPDIAWIANWPPEWKRSAPPIGGNDAALNDSDFQQWLALGVKLSSQGEARLVDEVARDPEAAVAAFRKASPAAQLSALPGVMAGLIDADPAQAAALLRDLPRGEAWAAAATRLADEWNQFDRPAAAAWIETLPPATAARLKERLARASTPRP